MKLITFTEVETTSPAEETVVGTTAPAEETVVSTTAAEETVAKDAESSVSAEAGLTSAPILTVGASMDGENVLLLTEEVAVTTAGTEATASIGFEPMNFVTNLQYMGTGMLTIFIVIGAIILTTTAINKIFSKKKD